MSFYYLLEIVFKMIPIFTTAVRQIFSVMVFSGDPCLLIFTGHRDFACRRIINITGVLPQGGI